jgi:hypothetical protein
MHASPDRVERQLDRIETLLPKLERAYRMAFEVGYATMSRDNGRGRSSSVADPTAHAALAAASDVERQLVSAAAVGIAEALNGLQGAWQNLQEAAQVLDDMRPPPAPIACGPLVTRNELDEARRMRQRHEQREREQRKKCDSR